MQYRADIDGLRAIAVLSVMAYHTRMEFAPGGFTGVDVFFVISGYLITKHIHEDIANGRFSIVSFYERRARRILPALAFTLIFSWIVAAALLLPSAMIDFSNSVVATVTFLSNFYFWKNSGYFDAGAQMRPLLHTWSLAVEEQFYIIMPVAMFVIYRLFRSFRIALFGLATIASLGLSIAIADIAPTANFFLLPTRAWELLLGAMLALSAPATLSSRLAREAIAIAGLLLILLPVAMYSSATPFPGVAATPPTLGAALLIYAGQGEPTRMTRLLSLKPLVAIGLVSYSLYLIHWPIITFVRQYTLTELDFWSTAFIIVASFALAAFSWRFIEQPFRNRQFLSKGQVFAGSATALTVIGAIGFAGLMSDGFRDRFPDLREQNTEIQAAHNWKPGECFLVNEPYQRWAGDTCLRTNGKSQTTLLWGDSYAAHYIPGIKMNEARLATNVLQFTSAGCPPILSYHSYAIPACSNFNSGVFDVISRYDIKSVIMAANWGLLRQRGFSGLRETYDRLRAAGVERIYVIGQSPTFVVDAAVLAVRRAGFAPDGSAAWPSLRQSELDLRAGAPADLVRVIEPREHLCQDDRCLYMRDKQLLYSDTGHFSPTGSAISVRTYFPFVESEVVAR